MSTVEGKTEVSYEEDKKHGQWIKSYWSGAVLHGSYEDGKEHGEFYGEHELCAADEPSLKVTVQWKICGRKAARLLAK